VADSSWASRLEEAHSRWLRERAELERASAEKLAAMEELAASRHGVVQGQLESCVAVISERLVGLAAKEGKKDRALKELKHEVRHPRLLSCLARHEWRVASGYCVSSLIHQPCKCCCHYLTSRQTPCAPLLTASPAGELA
jgi:hypothetical protein